MTSVTSLLIVVPARNEVAELDRCLVALEHSLERVRPRSVLCTPIIVLDSCTDGSDLVAARHPLMHPVAVSAGSAGGARAHGIEVGLRRRGMQELGRTWIATTDADSRVPREWLTDQLAGASAGFDLLTGTVVPDPDGLDPVVLQRWWARHPAAREHVFGANLGIRASSYRRAGGFRPLPDGEDVALVAAARQTGARWCADGRHPVVTSARLHGRAPGGFAQYLAGLTGAG